jgi:hypothetical protein
MICTLCDTHLSRGEPTAFVDGETVHTYCDVSAVGAVCADSDCQWWSVAHAGECVT